jgi:hypothetical protein
MYVEREMELLRVFEEMMAAHHKEMLAERKADREEMRAWRKEKGS